MSFIAGPYTWTLGSVSGPIGAAYSLGTIEDAPTLEISGTEVDPIRGDNLGAIMQDGVVRGGNCFIDFVLQEYNLTAMRYAIQPWATVFGNIGCIGSLLTTYADRLIGTPLSPTCTLGGIVDASSEAFKVFTGFKAVLAPGYPIRLLMGSRLRNVPIRFQLLPYEDPTDNNTRKFFKFAAP